MGASFSKKGAHPARTTAVEFEEQREQLQKSQLIRREVIRRSGVLLPPTFAVGSWELPLPASTCDLRLSSLPPSIYQSLHETDESLRLLRDYMVPGLWVRSVVNDDSPASVLGGGRRKPAANSSTTIKASVCFGDNSENENYEKKANKKTYESSDRENNNNSSGNRNEYDNSNRNSSYYQGRLRGEKWFTYNNVDVLLAQVEAGTLHTTAAPVQLSLAYFVLPQTLALQAQMDSRMLNGWVGLTGLIRLFSANGTLATETVDSMKASPSIENPACQFGLWAPFKYAKLDQSSPRYQQSHQRFSGLQVPEINAGVSMDYLGATAAADVNLNLDTLETKQCFYFTMDMTSNGGNDAFPLRITLDKTPEAIVMALTQVFAFDRLQLNPLEDRAPKIRNTAGWTIRLTRPDNDDMKNNEQLYNNRNGNATPSVEIGGAWQVNRGLALKTVINPVKSSMTTAILLKRWQEPRLLCSLLHRYNWKTSSSQFVGVGIELDSGGSDNDLASSNSLYQQFAPLWKQGGRSFETKTGL